MAGVWVARRRLVHAGRVYEPGDPVPECVNWRKHLRGWYCMQIDVPDQEMAQQGSESKPEIVSLEGTAVVQATAAVGRRTGPEPVQPAGKRKLKRGE